MAVRIVELLLYMEADPPPHLVNVVVAERIVELLLYMKADPPPHLVNVVVAERIVELLLYVEAGLPPHLLVVVGGVVQWQRELWSYCSTWELTHHHTLLLRSGRENGGVTFVEIVHGS